MARRGRRAKAGKATGILRATLVTDPGADLIYRAELEYARRREVLEALEREKEQWLEPPDWRSPELRARDEAKERR